MASRKRTRVNPSVSTQGVEQGCRWWGGGGLWVTRRRGSVQGGKGGLRGFAGCDITSLPIGEEDVGIYVGFLITYVLNPREYACSNRRNFIWLKMAFLHFYGKGSVGPHSKFRLQRPHPLGGLICFLLLFGDLGKALRPFLLPGRIVCTLVLLQ